MNADEGELDINRFCKLRKWKSPFTGESTIWAEFYINGCLLSKVIVDGDTWKELVDNISARMGEYLDELKERSLADLHNGHLK